MRPHKKIWLPDILSRLNENATSIGSYPLTFSGIINRKNVLLHRSGDTQKRHQHSLHRSLAYIFKTPPRVPGPSPPDGSSLEGPEEEHECRSEHVPACCIASICSSFSSSFCSTDRIACVLSSTSCCSAPTLSVCEPHVVASSRRSTGARRQRIPAQNRLATLDCSSSPPVVLESYKNVTEI